MKHDRFAPGWPEPSFLNTAHGTDINTVLELPRCTLIRSVSILQGAEAGPICARFEARSQPKQNRWDDGFYPLVAPGVF